MPDSGPVDRARDLADRARADPSAVEPAELDELADADAADARWYALQALRTAGTAGAVDLAARVDALETALSDPDSRVRSTAAMALGDAAVTDPSAAARALPTMLDLLSDEQDLVRTAVVDYLYRIAAPAGDPDGEVDPATLEPAIPALRDLLDDPEQRENAVQTLASVADRYAYRLTDDVAAFREVFLTASEGADGVDVEGSVTHQTREQLQESEANAKVRRRAVRNAAGDGLVAVARAEPSAVTDSLPALVDVLDDPNPDARSYVLELCEAVATEEAAAVTPYLDEIAERLEDATGVREHAALALTAVSQADPDAVVDAVEPHQDALVDLLDHGAPAVRGAAVGLLSYVAEQRPGAVDPAPVRPLLSDDHAYVRGNAVWVLGYLRDEQVREAVAERAESDPDPEVREAAAAALDRL